MHSDTEMLIPVAASFLHSLYHCDVWIVLQSWEMIMHKNHIVIYSHQGQSALARSARTAGEDCEGVKSLTSKKKFLISTSDYYKLLIITKSKRKKGGPVQKYVL